MLEHGDQRLHEITGHEAKFVPRTVLGVRRLHRTSTPRQPTPARRRLLADAHGLQDLGTAPEFTETEDWFNTPGDRSR